MSAIAPETKPGAGNGPARKRRRRRKLPWGYVVFLTLTLAAAAYLGFRVMLRQYLHGDAFLASINRAASQALQVDGAFAPLRWQDAQAASSAFRGEGIPGSAIRTIDARGLEAHLDYRGIWDGVWEITELSIEEATLDLQATGSARTSAWQSGESSHGEAATAISPPASARHDNGSLLGSLLPTSARLRKISIASAGGTFPIPGGRAGDSATARRLRIRATPLGDHFADGYQLTGYGGEIHLSQGRRLSLLDFDTRWRNGTLYISDAAADFKDTIGARVTCSGRIDTVRGESELELNLSGIDVEEVVAADWKRRVTGQLESNVTVRGGPSRMTSSGDLTMTGGTLHALPILDNLADFTRHDTFRHLPLNRATARFTREEGTTDFHDILLESTGTLRVTGVLRVQDDIASGTLQVGVVPGVLRWIPGAEQRVFTRLEDGHLWTEMRVHGPLQALNEDLSSRLVKGAITQTIKDAPERAVKAGKTVIEQGTSLLRKGVTEGIDLIDGFVPFLD